MLYLVTPHLKLSVLGSCEMIDNFHGDIHRIREKLTDELAGLSGKEIADLLNKSSEKVKKELNINLPRQIERKRST